MTESADRLVSLLSYIEQVEKLKKSAAFVVPDEYFRSFQADVVGLPGLEFNQIQNGDDLWLKIPRLVETAPPEPGTALLPWAIVSKSPDKLPVLRTEITRATSAGEKTLSLDSIPGLAKVFDTYVSLHWSPWSDAEKPRRKTIAIYNKLFALHQVMVTEGAEAAVELIWGMGVTVWRKEGSATTVKHPLITQSCEVSLDELSFGLEIRPREVDPILEIDCYAELEVAGVTPLEAFWDQHRSTAEERISPFESSTTEPLLRAAVGYLDPKGEFLQAGVQLPSPSEALQVSDSWVVYGRKRSEHVFLEDVKRLKKHLTEGVDLPPVLSKLVNEGALEVKERGAVQFRGLSSSGTGEGVQELYFPMPANAEQVSIIEMLESHDGVVVQGPPGTGKTHTIANVICHFLAQGKRVLVTSKGESALAVLQDKLPVAIRPLSVALLSDDKEGMKQFEHSIQQIAEQIASFDPTRVQKEIDKDEVRLGTLHQSMAALDHQIATLAERQLRAVLLDGKEISPEDLARFVLEKAPEHIWLEDPIEYEKWLVPPVSSAEVSALRAARLRLGTDIAYLDHEPPAADSMLSNEDMLQLHRDLCRAHDIDQSIAVGTVLPLVDGTAATFEKARLLYQSLELLIAQVTQIAGRGYGWSNAFRSRLQEAFDTSSEALLGVAGDLIAEDHDRKSRLSHPVVCAPDMELDKDVFEAIARCISGRSAFSMPMGKKKAREYLASVTVSGVKPKADDWKLVSAELHHRLRARKLAAAWVALANEAGIPGGTRFAELIPIARHALDIAQLDSQSGPKLDEEIASVFGKSVLGHLTGTELQRYEALHASLNEHFSRDQLKYARARVREAQAKLNAKSGDIVRRAEQFLGTSLGEGSGKEVEARLGTNWTAILSELRRLADSRSDLIVIDRVTTAIIPAAPLWGGKLRTIPAMGEADNLIPATWLESWQWRASATLLNKLEGHDALKALFKRRKSAEHDLAKTYQSLVANRAWLGVFRSSPEAVVQSLQTYLNAMQAIGAGTGIRALRHRMVARMAMQRAHLAVSCWILPHWRVSETLPAKVGAFDLVVIDEASQSDIWALPAMLRGKKILIVGDHKQVSPSAVGMAEQKIKDLAARFLRDQPHGSQMTPDRSIYDLARVIFAGSSVMLREHFRSVPAIIEYSNREFYQGGIKPLRLPVRAERLDPPLIDVFVQGGFRTGDVNEPEARAIVNEIKAILEDDTLVGRTIGVVTLMGMKQSQRIHDLVRRVISPRDVLERKIWIGAAPMFQGRERDIMLISMVATKSDRGPANRADFAQRYNVAASRARDRMILFRSIEESDVNADSLNAGLIRHFRQPFRQDAQKLGVLRDLCESDFEREMFDALVERGYRVRPQVKVGGYRIDFVVEGAEDRRLAVECDGDRFHGPAQWSDDMTRQRVLERAGWTFWRCFASSFVMRRQQVLDDLFQTLAKMGIENMGSESVDNTVWVGSRVLDPLVVSGEELLDEEDFDIKPLPRRRAVARHV